MGPEEHVISALSSGVDSTVLQYVRGSQSKPLVNPCTTLPQVGPEEHVICALSGGVDSTVAATLVHKVVGDRLHCVFVDNGLLRFKVGAPATLL